MPGLDAERVPGRERLVVAGDDVRVLVRLDADAVARCGARSGRRSPASAMTRRAAASTSSHGVPDGRGRAPPASCASTSTAYASRTSARRLADDEHAGDVGAVAVHRAAEVAQHDVAVADHPRRSARGAGSRRSRPRRRSRSSPARARASSIRSTSSRCTSSSVRPANGRVAHLRRDRVDRVRGARAAPRSRRRPSPSATAPMTSRRAARTRRRAARRWSASTNRAHVWSPIATRAPPARRARRRSAIGSSVSSHGTISNRSGCGVDARRLEPRARRARRRPSRGQHEHREPLERHRLVAGEVRQVGARPRAAARRRRARPCARAARAMRAASGIASSRRRARAGRRCSSAFFSARYSASPSSPLLLGPVERARSRSPTRSISGTA